jgi:hypothetical protein
MASASVPTIRVKLFCTNVGGSGTTAQVPVDGKEYPITQLFKEVANPGKVLADTVLISDSLTNVEVTLLDSGHPIKVRKSGEDQRFAGDNQDMTEFKIRARKTA